MSTYIEEKLLRHPSVYITENELAHILGGTEDSCGARIQRAVKKGLLVRIKRGLYCLLNERFAVSESLNLLVVAQLLYGPSYISLESALAHHNLIPERVNTITSVTIQRQKTIKTPFRYFTYHKLPTENFFIGVNYVQENHNVSFIASPWKALLDYVYCYKMQWKDVEPLQESLRIELEDLPKISQAELQQLDHFYHRKNVHNFIKNIPKDFIHEY